MMAVRWFQRFHTRFTIRIRDAHTRSISHLGNKISPNKIAVMALFQDVFAVAALYDHRFQRAQTAATIKPYHCRNRGGEWFQENGTGQRLSETFTRG